MYFQFDNFIKAHKQINLWLSDLNCGVLDPELYKEATVLVEFSSFLDESIPQLTDEGFVKGKVDYDTMYTDGDFYFRREKAYYDKVLTTQYLQKNIISYIERSKYSKRALLNFWKDEHKDLHSGAPCMTQVMFRLKDNRLDMHVTMRANDAYRVMLINFHLFSSAMKYVCDSLDLAVGKYYHYASSLHIYNEEKKDFLAFTQALKM